MIAARQFAACLVLVGLLFVVAIGVVSPAQGGADEHDTTTTTAAATTTAAPATTTAAPATTTTAPTATSTTARATTTTAPRTTTTSNKKTKAGTPAPATTSPPPSPEAATPAAAVTGAAVEGTEPQKETTVRQPIRPNVPSLPPSSTRSDQPVVKEQTGPARRTAVPLEPENDVGVQPNLAPLFEEEAPTAVAGQKPERGRLSNKPLAVAGLAVGALVGLLLGLADRAAGLAIR